MSDYAKYISNLEKAYEALSRLAQVCKYEFKSFPDDRREYKFVKRLFIKEAVKILKGKREHDDYFNHRDKISLMIKEAENTHDKRRKDKPKIKCASCGREIERETHFHIDDHYNAFCCYACFEEFKKIKMVFGSPYEYDKILKFQKSKQGENDR